MLRALWATLAQTGFRKAEVALGDGFKFGPDCLTRHNLRWRIDGTEFADVPTSSLRVWSTASADNSEVECTGITRVSANQLICTYPVSGSPQDGCDGRKRDERLFQDPRSGTWLHPPSRARSTRASHLAGRHRTKRGSSPCC